MKIQNCVFTKISASYALLVLGETFVRFAIKPAMFYLNKIPFLVIVFFYQLKRRKVAKL